MRGYDVSEEELNPGVIAIAVPILVGDKVMGSIGLGIPSVRYDPDKLQTYIQKMQQTAGMAQHAIIQNHLYTFAE